MGNVKQPKPTFLLTLEAKPAAAAAEVRLRRALKCLARAFGFRVVRVKQLSVDG